MTGGKKMFKKHRKIERDILKGKPERPGRRGGKRAEEILKKAYRKKAKI